MTYLSIDRVLNREPFTEESSRKCVPKVSPIPHFKFDK